MDGGLTLLVGGGTAFGSITWLLWMVGTGRLVTRREVDGRLADKDQQIADLKKTVEIKDAQVGKLADETGATMIRILESLDMLGRRRAPR